MNKYMLCSLQYVSTTTIPPDIIINLLHPFTIETKHFACVKGKCKYILHLGTLVTRSFTIIAHPCSLVLICSLDWFIKECIIYKEARFDLRSQANGTNNLKKKTFKHSQSKPPLPHKNSVKSLFNH